MEEEKNVNSDNTKLENEQMLAKMSKMKYMKKLI